MAGTALTCDDCPVRDSAACSSLSHAERGELVRRGRKIQLSAGETLFAAGDDHAGCATLTRGAMKISSIDEHGTERILSLVHPAGFVGEMFGAVAHHDIIALTDSEVCLFSRRDYEAAIERYPALSRAMLRRTAEDLYQSRALIEMMGRHTARERVGIFLQAMARAASDSPCHPAPEFDLPVSRGEMAGMLGLTIETVSRAFSALERDGVIRRKKLRGIEIIDSAQLGKI